MRKTLSLFGPLAVSHCEQIYFRGEWGDGAKVQTAPLHAKATLKVFCGAFLQKKRHKALMLSPISAKRPCRYCPAQGGDEAARRANNP